MEITLKLLINILLMLTVVGQVQAAGVLIKQSAIPTKATPVGTDRVGGINSELANASVNFLLSALPISTPMQTALNLKANISGQCWPGIPTTDNQIIQSTGIGTCAWTSIIDGLINDAGTAVDDILSAAEVDIRVALKERKASIVPSTASSTCVLGEWAFDTGYEYRCIATNTWKRATLSTW